MSELDVRAQVIDQLAFAWEYMLLPRMDGLSDDEYLWAPVADVWTVYPGSDGGPATVDEQREADPAPFTTIAWRMHHMADFFTKRWVNHFGDPATDAMDAPVALTAAEGLANLQTAYERWKAALEHMPAERLAAPCGAAEGPYFGQFPFMALMLHLNREFIHHAAECALIRDLYRQRATLG